MKTCIRYKVTHDGQEHWHDNMPSDDRIARIEEYVTNRGGHAKIEQVTTKLLDIPWGQGKLQSEFKLLFEIEG